MKIVMERPQRELSLRFSGTAGQLLKKLSINPETVLVVRNGVIVLGDAKLTNTDDIRLVSVISGG